ncbi:MAG: D-alanyl-D-alanine carboxypeptidase family protein [Pikeienuella sp.]
MNPYDWSRFAVGGAASRPDSFTGLDPTFASGVYSMVNDAHAAGYPLQITSAYRSPELQGQLYANAIEKYGSPEAARKWVAPPGRSKHNSGTAVDFALNGGLLRDANSPAAQWVAENAANYGLSVPMSWEPWQVEPMGSRGGGTAAGGGSPVAAQTVQESGGIFGLEPTPEEKRNGILAGLGQELMAMEQPQAAPVQFAPRQATSVQASTRDPMEDYLKFIQSLEA